MWSKVYLVVTRNTTYIGHWSLGFSLSSFPFARFMVYKLQVADLYVIVKTKHIRGEGGKVSNWDKLVSILFLFIVQQVNCCHRVCLAKVLLEFSNVLIHFDAWRFTLIPVIHHHRHKCFPIALTAPHYPPCMDGCS